MTRILLALAMLLLPRVALADFYCITVRDHPISTTACSPDREQCETVRRSLDDEAFAVGRCTRVPRAFCYTYDDDDSGDSSTSCSITAAQCNFLRNATRRSNRFRSRYSNIDACTSMRIHPDAPPPTPAATPTIAVPDDGQEHYFCEMNDNCHRAQNQCDTLCDPAAHVWCILDHGAARCFRTEGSCGRQAAAANAEHPLECFIRP